MGYKEISKSGKENYNLLDYDLARKNFNWWKKRNSSRKT